MQSIVGFKLDSLQKKRTFLLLSNTVQILKQKSIILHSGSLR